MRLGTTCVFPLLGFVLTAQNTGTIRGKVTLLPSNEPLHDAHVLLFPGGRAVESAEDGTFEFKSVPPGKYQILARMAAMNGQPKDIEVRPGESVTADIPLSLDALRQELTVTASGAETSVEEAFQTVTSRESFDLAIRAQGTSMGDLLEQESGIAKRSSGPGSSRPVVRGFDGDRVLMLQDGVRTGTLGYQSGDHGEPIDVQSVERVEVVRGPATLLYGSSAIGGVVNVISSEHVLHQQPHDGLIGKVNGLLGSNNAQAQGSANLSYGHKNWLIYGGGGGTRAGDYKSALGRVLNSASDMQHGQAGVGHFGKRFSFNLSFQGAKGKYGIPFDEHADADEEHGEHEGEGELPDEKDGHAHEKARLDWSRYNFKFNGAVKGLGSFVEEFQYSVNYSRWKHSEILLEDEESSSGMPITVEELGTQFFNRQWTYQGLFQQRRKGILTGRFGFWGLSRGYEARGEEALAPRTSQQAIAGYALEELNFERIRFQFGARVENNRYRPAGDYRERSFTGASASAGAIVPLWKGGSVVGNYMHSYRAPALEELYNYGPHHGNSAFEIGDSNLKREMGDGLELSVRHNANRLRLQANLFRYHMHDFVYLRPTGQFDDGLPVADYKQADSRFVGADARAEIGLHPSFWLLFGFDAVDAQLTQTRENLPRIPPVRGRIGFDWRWRGLSVRPEAILANSQPHVSTFETPTAGYAAFNLLGSYTIARAHVMHMFTANVFNLGDTVYRNHLSFVKQFAPEIGRGVRFGYTFQWF